MEIFENYNLSNKNSLKLQSTCARFINLFEKNDILKVLKEDFFDKNNFFILGEGSNVILPEFFTGTVLHPNFLGIECLNLSENESIIKVQAGESWSKLINYSLEKNLLGLENLTLIPGSVGAAPIQNIGAYGVEVCECIDSVEVFNFDLNDFEILSAAQCQFSYRDSIFKRHPDTYLVITVSFRLKHKAELNCSYLALKNRLQEQGLSVEKVTQRQVSETVSSIRKERLPDPNVFPNVGSFFKNPVIDVNSFNKLQTQYPDIVSFPQPDNSVKLSAAWLIERAGWKGRRVGGLMVSERHALVIINRDTSNQKELLLFAKQIQKDVQERFLVSLEIEPVIK